MPGMEPSVASSIREIAKPPGTGPKCTFAVVWIFAGGCRAAAQRGKASASVMMLAQPQSLGNEAR
jgi:hypothetical protein